MTQRGEGREPTMNKKTFQPGEKGFNTFYPGSVVLVSAVDSAGKPDICTVGAWALVNGVPRMYGVALCARPAHTYFFKRLTTAPVGTQAYFLSYMGFQVPSYLHQCIGSSHFPSPQPNNGF